MRQSACPPGHSLHLVSLLQSRWRGYAMRLEYEKNAGMASERVKPTQVAPDPEA